MESREFDHHRKMLRRIIAVLFRLALLAERSSTAPAAVRFLVLWVLRPGEAIARQMVIELAEDFGYLADLPQSPALQRDGADDAMHLAFRLRAIAELLQFLRAEMRSPPDEPCRGRPASRFQLLCEECHGLKRRFSSTRLYLPDWTSPAADTS